jgi:hypothetical protein
MSTAWVDIRNYYLSIAMNLIRGIHHLNADDSMTYFTSIDLVHMVLRLISGLSMF